MRHGESTNQRTLVLQIDIDDCRFLGLVELHHQLGLESFVVLFIVSAFLEVLFLHEVLCPLIGYCFGLTLVRVTRCTIFFCESKFAAALLCWSRLGLLGFEMLA